MKTKKQIICLGLIMLHLPSQGLPVKRRDSRLLLFTYVDIQTTIKWQRLWYTINARFVSCLSWSHFITKHVLCSFYCLCMHVQISSFVLCIQCESAVSYIYLLLASFHQPKMLFDIKKKINFEQFLWVKCGLHFFIFHPIFYFSLAWNII